MNEFLIYSKRCFIANRFQEATLHIKYQRIHHIHSGFLKQSALPLIDCSEFIVMPGIIDAHVHINEPGREHWEGFDTATKAAAIGGITTLIEMPLNASPVTVDREAFRLKQKAAAGKLHVNCGFYGGVVPGNHNTLEDLIQAGVFGIKGFLTHSGIDEFPQVGRSHLEAIAPLLKKYDLPLLLHCELSDSDIPEVHNPKSYNEYLNSRPSRWEENAIALALDIQERFDIRVHIVHLSAAEVIPRIGQRRQQTDKLTVETCPHYLYFNAEDIPDGAPLYKCAPPIRSAVNNNALWEFLLDGGFDFLASDHSPAPPERKQLEKGDFFKAWGGISGLQYTLPVLFTEGNKRGLPLEQLISLLTKEPARFLGLDYRKGHLKTGYDADITIWDDTRMFTVSEDSILHKHKATPYLNRQVFGKVIHTFVNGTPVVKNGALNVLQKGKLLLKNNEPIHRDKIRSD